MCQGYNQRVTSSPLTLLSRLLPLHLLPPLVVLHILLFLQVQSIMDCTGRWLSSIPGNLRGDTEELFLDDNTIRVLGNASLLLYPQLWHLSLARNRLELIEPGAFLSS